MISVHSEDALQGWNVLKQMTGKEPFSSIFKQSILYLIRVINLTKKCRLSGHFPNMSMLELQNTSVSDTIFSKYFCQKKKLLQILLFYKSQDSILL